MSELVYFIGNGSAVKVGYTSDLQRRMMTLATASSVPLKLIGVVPGNRKLEALLHAQLDKDRLHGEWFRTEPALDVYRRLSGQENLHARIRELEDRCSGAEERIRLLNEECCGWRRRAQAAEAALGRAHELDEFAAHWREPSAVDAG
jgi:hypothetical protein